MKKVFDDTQAGFVGRQPMKINLQLFATSDPNDEDDTEDDFWEDDENENDELEGAEDDEDEDEDDEAETDQDVADPDESEPQSKEMNGKFAKARKENARLKLEAFEKENAELKSRLAQLETTGTQKSIEDQITDEMVWSKADEEGISESAARKLLYYELKEKNEKQAKTIETKKAAIKGKPYFAEIESDFNAWLDREPHLDPEAMYTYLVGANIDRLRANTESSAKKKAIADLQDKSRRSLVTTGTGGSKGDDVDYSNSLTQTGREMALAFGNSPKDIAKYTAQQLKNRRR
jgi:hypothetical protein